MAQQYLAGGPGPAFFPQGRGEWFDAVEDVRDPRLVMGQHQTFCQDVGDQLQPFGRAVAQQDVAGSVDMLLGPGGSDQEAHLLAFRHREGARNLGGGSVRAANRSAASGPAPNSTAAP